MIDNIYYQGLCAVKEVFLKHDITFWLEAGSLIGAIREGRIIKDDNDFDVSIYEIDCPRILKKLPTLQNEFKKHGFDFNGTWRFGLSKNGDHIGCILPVIERDGFLIKVIRDDGGNRKLKFVRARHETVGNLAWVKMYNKMMPIPEHPEDYLGARFGTSWMKAQHWGKHQRPRNFDPYYKNVRTTGIFPARMNPPHIGHFMTLANLLKTYKIIYVYLYDDKDDFMALSHRKHIIETIAGEKVKVIIEKTGFRFRDYFGDVQLGTVLSGNQKVIKNCKKHGVLTQKVDRFPDYSGCYIRESMQCNICGEKKYLFDVTDLPQRRSNMKYTGLLPFPYTHICQQCYFKLLKKYFEKIR